ncbi:MAG TPA: thioesterase [Saprospiraceae bacterium]|nr:hypothetical protein [Saprospiraceae bacterium]HPG06302.1 thioesterase [Saprospiraceae bacterium]HPQ98395.1 thioesterase [Saprospiraceae bacterium]HQU51764.1 thioesterase [Saprospiraceae bacterium]HRV86654.1 thioesterase [Saprospiraceae bacterium]
MKDKNENLPEEQLVLVMDAEVTSADADLIGRLRPGALENLFIQSAIRSADRLGFGFTGLREQKLFWVLSRITIEIMAYPRWPAVLTIETWPKDVQGLLYLRDFVARDERGQPFALATSAWLAIDLERKRPTTVSGRSEDYFTRLRNKSALIQPPEKLGAPQEPLLVKELSTGYSDYDLNKHVTATRYLDFMCNALPLDYWLEHYPRHISINYLRETLAGEHLSMRWKGDQGHFDFAGYHESTNALSFLGKLQF